jgi:hypothetical protein
MLSEFKRRIFFKIVIENKYRGVFHKTNLDKPIDYFMNVNSPVLFSDALFKFLLKTPNQ